MATQARTTTKIILIPSNQYRKTDKNGNGLQLTLLLCHSIYRNQLLGDILTIPDPHTDPMLLIGSQVTIITLPKNYLKVPKSLHPITTTRRYTCFHKHTQLIFLDSPSRILLTHMHALAYLNTFLRSLGTPSLLGVPTDPYG